MTFSSWREFPTLKLSQIVEHVHHLLTSDPTQQPSYSPTVLLPQQTVTFEEVGNATPRRQPLHLAARIDANPSRFLSPISVILPCWWQVVEWVDTFSMKEANCFKLIILLPSSPTCCCCCWQSANPSVLRRLETVFFLNFPFEAWEFLQFFYYPFCILLQ